MWFYCTRGVKQCFTMDAWRLVKGYADAEESQRMGAISLATVSGISRQIMQQDVMKFQVVFCKEYDMLLKCKYSRNANWGVYCPWSWGYVMDVPLVPLVIQTLIWCSIVDQFVSSRNTIEGSSTFKGNFNSLSWLG